MLKLPVYLAVAVALSSCALFRSSTSDELASDPRFRTFPRRFSALQTLLVDWRGESKTVIASLRRDESEYRVTFLHAAFQTPLLELRNFGPEAERTRYFVERDRLPFQPKMVLDAIIALYNAKTFAPDPEKPSGLKLTTDTAVYRLRDLQNFDGCPFPETIELRFRAGEAGGDGQVLPLLTVETKELECR